VREAENECSQEMGSILRISYKRQISGTVDAINEEPDSIEEEKKIKKQRNYSNATDEESNKTQNLSSSSEENKKE
jgi:hypothetical protein